MNIKPRLVCGHHLNMDFGKIIFTDFVFIAALFIFSVQTERTVVLIHGLLANKGELRDIDTFINETHPGTKVVTINVLYNGKTLIPMWDQVKTFADEFQKIAHENPEGITLIGFSQGGLIARAIVETIPNHNVHTLISIASPQMGTYGIPDELIGKYNILTHFIKYLKWLAYSMFGQLISVGGYWKDPYDIDKYKNKSQFLPILNNEISHSQEKEFKNNFLQLKRFVLFGSPADEVIKPWESSIFGYCNSENKIVPMKEQEVYKKDSFGLKTLDNKNAVYTIIIPKVTHHHWLNDFKLFRNYIIAWLN